MDTAAREHLPAGVYFYIFRLPWGGAKVNVYIDMDN